MYNNSGSISRNLLWVVVALVSISALILIKQFSPFIPDYDGLNYFDIAKKINKWLFFAGDYKIAVGHTNDFVYFWPISNALTVYIAAIFFNTVDVNVLPVFINSLYLFLFVAYIAKLRSTAYALVVAFLLCGNLLFFRLFTTLTTEFSVGLWIFAFLLSLVSISDRRGIFLGVLVVVGLLLRTIDIVFILMSISAYGIVYYLLWREKDSIVEALRSVCLVLVVTAPFFLKHYIVAFNYVYSVSFGETAESWKSLGGVSNRYDVLIQYVKYLHLYNQLIIPLFLLLFGFCLFFGDIRRKFTILVLGVAFSICLPLFLASSLNVQVVFWVYSSLVFVICECGFLMLQEKGEWFDRYLSKYAAFKNAYVFLALSVFLFFGARSWAYEVSYLKQQYDISKISFDIADVLDSAPGAPVIASNFRGVGAIDVLGLSWRKQTAYSYGGIQDIYSKNRKPSEYLELAESTNFFIAAQDNYFFAPHFGINSHVAETHRLFSEKSAELGFLKIYQIARSGRYFDIWYRPGAEAYPQYINFNDSWISYRLPIEIGAEKICGPIGVTGNLKFKLHFQNPGVASFAPPFFLSIRKDGSETVLSSAAVDRYGVVEVVFPLEHVSCGRYSMHIDKAFTTNADPRHLSAQFLQLNGAFKFDINYADK